MAQPPPGTRDEDFPEPPRLRRLRHLVTALILVLILGVVIVVAALVISLGSLFEATPAEPVTADSLVLPAGEEIVSVGEGRGAVLVVTRDAAGAERLYSFDRTSGERLSGTAIERE